MWRTRLRDRLFDHVSRKDIRAAFLANQRQPFAEQLRKSVRSGVASLTSDRTVKKIGINLDRAERLALEKVSSLRRLDAVPIAVATAVVDSVLQLLLERKQLQGKGGK